MSARKRSRPSSNSLLAFFDGDQKPAQSKKRPRHVRTSLGVSPASRSSVQDKRAKQENRSRRQNLHSGREIRVEESSSEESASEESASKQPSSEQPSSEQSSSERPSSEQPSSDESETSSVHAISIPLQPLDEDNSVKNDKPNFMSHATKSQRQTTKLGTKRGSFSSMHAKHEILSHNVRQSTNEEAAGSAHKQVPTTAEEDSFSLASDLSDESHFQDDEFDEPKRYDNSVVRFCAQKMRDHAGRVERDFHARSLQDHTEVSEGVPTINRHFTAVIGRVRSRLRGCNLPCFYASVSHGDPCEDDMARVNADRRRSICQAEELSNRLDEQKLKLERHVESATRKNAKLKLEKGRAARAYRKKTHPLLADFVSEKDDKGPSLMGVEYKPAPGGTMARLLAKLTDESMKTDDHPTR